MPRPLSLLNSLGAAGLLLGAPAAEVLRQRRGRKATERLAAATLETLLGAIDANDPETGAHVRRVAQYALILSEFMGLDATARRSVERVALFHDVGKIRGALFDILHENSTLTDAERRVVRLHPEYGARVLRPLRAFYPELPAGVLSHHERWDGTGYPRRLAGRRIPLAARIVSVADVFDAVTQTRPYRGPSTGTQGAEVICQGRGTQFDPDIVDLFLCPPVLDSVVRAMDRSRHTLRARAPRQASFAGRVADVPFRWRTERASRRARC